MPRFMSHITLANGRMIGPGCPTYVIAEIGSNHDGSLEKAKRLIEAAANAGVDAVKFQSFQAHTLINPKHYKDGQWSDHPAWDILERLTLPEDWHKPLQECAVAHGVDFLSAPFDFERLALLDQLNVPAIKLASGELTNHGLLQAVARCERPVILATGVSDLGEVEAALNVLYEAGCNQVVLLHCVSLYPPQFEDANIRAMVTMGQAFQVPVGYSDHTPGHTVPLGAVALGGCVIEKHMTDDRSLPGPDHPYALTVEEFKTMVAEIRHLEAALGTGIKAPAQAEMFQKEGARRAVYTAVDIPSGTVLEPQHLKVVRHAYAQGIPAPEYPNVLGLKTTMALKAHDILTWEAFCS